MSRETQELEFIDACHERFCYYIENCDKKKAFLVYKALERLGISEPVKESLQDQLMRCAPYVEGTEVGEYPTQEDINS